MFWREGGRLRVREKEIERMKEIARCVCFGGGGGSLRVREREREKEIERMKEIARCVCVLEGGGGSLRVRERETDRQTDRQRETEYERGREGGSKWPIDKLPPLP